MARLYVPVDVNMPDDPKVVTAGPDAEHLYLRGLMLAKRIGGDGFIARQHLYRLCGDFTCVELDAASPQDLAAALVDAGLWVEVEGGYRIAAWLSHNPSDDELQSKRDEARDRKAKWRQSQRDTNDRDASVPTGQAVPATQRDTHESESESEGESDIAACGKRATRPDQSFTIDAALTKWASEKVPGVDLDRERDAWLDWCAAGGKKFVDHRAAFQTWCRRAHGFQAPQLGAQKNLEPPPAVRERDGVRERFMPGAGWIQEAAG